MGKLSPELATRQQYGDTGLASTSRAQRSCRVVACYMLGCQAIVFYFILPVLYSVLCHLLSRGGGAELGVSGVPLLKQQLLSPRGFLLVSCSTAVRDPCLVPSTSICQPPLGALIVQLIRHICNTQQPILIINPAMHACTHRLLYAESLPLTVGR